jgi:hypothetical protein
MKASASKRREIVCWAKFRRAQYIEAREQKR